MPGTSALEIQAADIGYYTLGGLSQGQWSGQVSKAQFEGMAAAIIMLATSLYNLRTALAVPLANIVTATAAGSTLSAAQQNAVNNSTLPGGTNGSYTTTSTILGQWTNTDVAMANLNGTYVIAAQQP